MLVLNSSNVSRAVSTLLNDTANPALNRSAVIMRFYFLAFRARARLALRYASIANIFDARNRRVLRTV